MHDDLGERLLQAGVITQPQLDSLQLAPTTSGGTIVRDVLRLGADESAIYAFFERRGYGPPADAAFLAGHDSSLTARIPRSTVNRLLALPLSRVSGAVLAAMADPSDRAAVAELAHRLDSPIRTVLARVSDLEALIHRAYGDGTPSVPPRSSTVPFDRVVPHETPAIDLIKRRPSDARQLPVPAGIALATQKTKPSEPPIPLVRPAGAGTKPSEPVATPHASAGTERDLPRALTPTTEPDIDAAVAQTAQIAPRRSSRPPAATAQEIPRTAAAPTREFAAPTAQRPSTATFNSLAGAPPVPIENSLREIARATERDVVLRAACNATATVCRSAVFLARRRDLLIGWEGAGVGIARDTIRDLWLPISGPSVFRDALSRARDYLGPPGTSSIDCVYRAVTGSRGGVMLIRPVMLRGKVIALLAVDGLSYGDQGAIRVTTVVNAVIEAFERIILANKAAGRPSEPPNGV